MHSAHQLLVHRHANSRSRVPFLESAADSPCSEWCACFRLTTPLVCMRSHAVRQRRRSAPISSLCSNLRALRSATPAVFSGFPPSHTFRVSCRIVVLSNNKLGGGTIEGESLGTRSTFRSNPKPLLWSPSIILATQSHTLSNSNTLLMMS